MKKLRIYVDTSVIGGCCDDEFSEWSNRLMHEFIAGRHIPVVSDVVEREILDAPEEVVRKYFELQNVVEIVGLSEEAEVLAEAYVARGVLTAKYRDDATHIALATVHHVDLVVSWNFRHIVHYDKIRMFNAINLELGYKMVEIYSPREVCREC